MNQTVYIVSVCPGGEWVYDASYIDSVWSVESKAKTRAEELGNDAIVEPKELDTSEPR